MSNSEVPEVIGDNNGFTAILFECIDDGLLTLGEGTRTALYRSLAKKYQLPAIHYMQTPLALLAHLQESLSRFEYGVLEKLIIREIRMTFDLKETDLTLGQVVDGAKAKFDVFRGNIA